MVVLVLNQLLAWLKDGLEVLLQVVLLMLLVRGRIV
jgi:hypothetical protein